MNNESKLDKELRAHLAQQIEDYIATGMSRDEAERHARLDFGGVEQVKEECREARSTAYFTPSLSEIARDLRYGARMLRRNQLFTCVAVLTLALGIGANTTIFSVVNTVLLRPLPYREPQRLMMLDEKWMPRFPRFEATPGDFLAWREQTKTFEDIAAFTGAAFNMSQGERAQRIIGARITANLTTLLGAEPIIGRGFTPEEDRDGANHVVLIGHQIWQDAFGSDPHITGKSIRLSGENYQIVGVMPKGFQFPWGASQIWRPMAFTRKDLNGDHFVWGAGRLKPGASRDQAEAEMNAIMHRLDASRPWSVNVTPMLEYYVGDVQKPLWILLGAAGFVLLIACINVSNLLLSRANVRQREILLRVSLGATRGRIIRQLLTENMLLAALGTITGLILAASGVNAARGLALSNVPRLTEVSLDSATLAFSAGLAALVTVLFALMPALRLSRGVSLHDSARSIAGARNPMRNTLIVSEVALALVLLTGAGLLLKSLVRLLDVQPGFRPEQVLTATINLPAAGYGQPAQQVQFAGRFLEALSANPQVRLAAISTGLPLVGVSDAGIRIDGSQVGAPDAGTTANYYQVSPEYLQTMGIALKRGRFFTAYDSAGRAPVVVINETMAKRFYPNQDPIGRRIDISGPAFLREIVGVVADVKQQALRAPVAPQVYEPFAQQPARSFKIVVRGVGEATRLADSIRASVAAIDPDQATSAVRPMQEVVSRSVSQDRFAALLLGIFAFVALALAAVGIYGVMAYSVAQRTREIGIRVALGARRSAILQLVIGHSLRIAAIGVGIGLVGSVFLTRVLRGMLFGVEATDPATFATVAGGLFLIAMLAAFVPARRASRVDPMVALRYE